VSQELIFLFFADKSFSIPQIRTLQKRKKKRKKVEAKRKKSKRSGDPPTHAHTYTGHTAARRMSTLSHLTAVRAKQTKIHIEDMYTQIEKSQELETFQADVSNIQE